jgi:hypothetical protein
VRERVPGKDGDCAEYDLMIDELLHIPENSLRPQLPARIDTLITMNIERDPDTAEEYLLLQKLDMPVGENCQIRLRHVVTFNFPVENLSLQYSDRFIIFQWNHEGLASMPNEMGNLKAVCDDIFGDIAEYPFQSVERHSLLVCKLGIFVAVRAPQIAML